MQTATPLSRPAPSPNIFAPYSLVSRLAYTLLSHSHMFNQFSYGVVSVESGFCYAVITILAWNSSIRAGGGEVKGWGVEESGVGDLPCLKVRYRPGETPRGGAAKCSVHSTAVNAVWVTEEEGEEVLGELQASTLLLPPSLRALQGEAIGFMPFRAFPLRYLTH